MNEDPNHHEFVFRSLRRKILEYKFTISQFICNPIIKKWDFRQSFREAESYATNAISTPNLSLPQINRVVEDIKDVLQ